MKLFGSVKRRHSQLCFRQHRLRVAKGDFVGTATHCHQVSIENLIEHTCRNLDFEGMNKIIAQTKWEGGREQKVSPAKANTRSEGIFITL